VSAYRDPRNWTVGCEHELADWSCSVVPIAIPGKWGIDKADVTIVNSDGIAAYRGPGPANYHVGGELNSPPSRSCAEQAQMIEDVTWVMPESRVNHRSNLHVHVRVPGLSGDLAALKQFAEFNREHLRLILDHLEPIPQPSESDYASREEFEGARRRYRRRLVSHHTVLTDARAKAQLEAQTVEEFFAAECPRSKDGKVMWHLAPRCAVNLRHLREPTDTVEFRHFPGTLEGEEVLVATNWCKEYVAAALGLRPGFYIDEVRDYARGLPKFPPYVHWREVRYRATCMDGTLSVEQVLANRKKITEGEFDDVGPERYSE
jgi:hypothetical protein